MSEHQAIVQSASSFLVAGPPTWFATCPCGWTSGEHAMHSEAALAADDHVTAEVAG